MAARQTAQFGVELASHYSEAPKIRPPLALYVHIPWCEKKCPYCDFNSHPLKKTLPEQAYVDALCTDFSRDWNGWILPSKRQIDSVFIGGGTPSLFQAKSFVRLLTHIKPYLAAHAEITLEANPGTLDEEKLQGYVDAGINRLSIGAQSSHAHHLKCLGRIHSKEDTERSVQAARQAGLKRLNLDMMFGLPEQSRSEAIADLDWALAMQPEHLSCYQLTIEANTVFAVRPPKLPNSELLDAMHQALSRRLAQAGYRQYEISAFAKPRQRCRHNLAVWRFADYLGIGAGAHGKITTNQGIFRYAKVRSPSHYQSHICGATKAFSQRQLNDRDRFNEFLINALRLRDGFSFKLWADHSGLDPAQLVEALKAATEARLLLWGKGRVRASAKGYRLLDQLLLSIMR